MEKVKVTKEVAEAFEEVRAKHSDDILIKTTLNQQWNRRCFALNGIGVETLVNMIYYGYYTTMTPEEIIKEKYDELIDYEPLDRACKDSFRFVLDTLGIKIAGVNA